MTYIPGTGSLKPVAPSLQPDKSARTPEVFSTVNVQELKTPKEVEATFDIDPWYFQLKYWMLFGSIPSLVFAILAISDWRSLFLIPLAPYTAYLTWHIRKWVKKHSKNLDVFAH